MLWGGMGVRMLKELRWVLYTYQLLTMYVVIMFCKLVLLKTKIKEKCLQHQRIQYYGFYGMWAFKREIDEQYQA